LQEDFNPIFKMPKKFNITGTCFPDRHYMADISAKFKIALSMIEEGDCFTINRPRQFGKTTMLYRLFDTLKKGMSILFSIPVLRE
jgi:hypothetical protein